MAMQVSPKFLFALSSVLVVLVAVPLCAISDPESDRLGELYDLQSRSKSGVIHINDHSVQRFLSSVNTPRPYYLFIFFDAVKLHEKTELQLKELQREFSLLASSFIANNINNNASSNLFFCYIEFKESRDSFARFGVESLPNIRLVAPDVTDLKDSDQVEQGDASRMADAMADFIASKTSFRVGTIHHPPILSRAQVLLLAVVVLVWTPFAAKKIFTGETVLHDSKIWLSGSVFVYFFSVSGAMHNIIRQMPMFLLDRNEPSKLVFFYQGSGMQLGGEGFAVGFLYTVVGLMLALVTHLLVRVRNVTVQRGVMVFVLLVSFWAVKKVVFLDNWKTGYRIHAFWPSSWN